MMLSYTWILTTALAVLSIAVLLSPGRAKGSPHPGLRRAVLVGGIAIIVPAVVLLALGLNAGILLSFVLTTIVPSGSLVAAHFVLFATALGGQPKSRPLHFLGSAAFLGSIGGPLLSALLAAASLFTLTEERAILGFGITLLFLALGCDVAIVGWLGLERRSRAAA